MAASRIFETNSRVKVFNEVFGADSANFTFKFVDSAADISDPPVLKVHKKVLAAISPVFSTLFKGQWKKINAIAITDASYAAFECFMQYFYKDRIEVSQANVVDVLHLAYKYEVTDLAFNCELFMSGQISIANVLDYYSAASRLDLNLVQIHCEKLFSEQPERVLKLPEFIECDKTTLAAFLRNVPASCDVGQVFDACIEWAKRACRLSGSNPADMADVRAQLGACFELIRFTDMTFEAITGRYKMLTALFTKDEMDDVFERIFDHIRHRYVQPLNGTKLELCGEHFLDVDIVAEGLSFTVSATVILHSITAAKTWRETETVGFTADVRVMDGDTKLFECTKEFPDDGLLFVLPTKIVLDAGTVYTVVVYRPDESVNVDGYMFKRQRLADVDFVPMVEQTDIECADGVTCAISSIEFIR